MVLPEAIETVAVAAPGFTLHLISLEVTLVTGELDTGRRTAAVEVVLPAIRVVQMSVGYVKHEACLVEMPCRRTMG
jgi:hypothetical protein